MACCPFWVKGSCVGVLSSLGEWRAVSSWCRDRGMSCCLCWVNGVLSLLGEGGLIGVSSEQIRPSIGCAHQINPQPSTLNTQSSTLNPQPSTPSHQPSTLNPQHPVINPQPSTLNHHPSNLQPSNHQSSTLNPQTSTLKHQDPRASFTHNSPFQDRDKVQLTTS